MLAISVKDQRELLYHYEWIKRGKGTVGDTGFSGEVQLLTRGLYFAWNCLFPDTQDGIHFTWPVDIWIIHWDSQCKSVERKQAFSQWFTGSNLRNNPCIPTSFYSWWRQPAQTKTVRWDSFCLTYFRFTAKPRLLITIVVTHFLLNWVCLIANCIQNPTKLCYSLTHGGGPVW